MYYKIAKAKPEGINYRFCSTAQVLISDNLEVKKNYLDSDIV